MKLLGTALSVIALSLAAGMASATVITFEDSAQTSGATPSTQGDVTVSGYYFDSSSDHTHYANNYGGGDSGSTFFGADNYSGSNTVTMTEENGSIFSLFSLDLGSWYEDSSNLSITGYLSNGDSITTDIALGLFSTYELVWTNLTSIVFESTAGSGDQYWGVDNINVTTSVPAPGSLALFAIGLLGLAATRRNIISDKA
ncbi:hypothetical protein A9Q99_19405 [Gammaproteobacteria bacterium 45_16_T64]|nr:hypothetical protein A9Q99_19405 [Gammaproteobacteria bacterium 45_16_T64]